MKKMLKLFLFLLIGTVCFSQLNVKALNENLMLEQGYTQLSWSKQNNPQEIIKLKPKYDGAYSIHYKKTSNGIEEFMNITYAPIDKTAKGHWNGEVLSLDISVNNIVSGKKISFKNLENMINAFVKNNTDKKQNKILLDTYKNKKDGNKILVNDFPTQKSIMINYY